MQDQIEAPTPGDHRAASDRKRLWSEAVEQQKSVIADPRFKDLGGRVQAVLLVLVVEWCDRFAECWPSVGLLAEVVGCDETCVRRALTRLEALGMISFPRGRKGGRVVRNGRPVARTNFVRVDAALANPGENTRVATQAKLRGSTQAKTPELTQAKSPAEQGVLEPGVLEQDTPSMPPADAGGAEGVGERERLALLVDVYADATDSAFTTRSERKQAERWMKELVDVGCTVDELRAAVSAWGAQYDYAVTARALTTHWTTLMRKAREYEFLTETGEYVEDPWGLSEHRAAGQSPHDDEAHESLAGEVVHEELVLEPAEAEPTERYVPPLGFDEVSRTRFEREARRRDAA